MGILERLGNLIGSYLNDGGFGRHEREYPEDPELRAAYEELDEFLGRAGTGERDPEYGGASGAAGGGDYRAAPPGELEADFAELGVPFGSGRKACRDAYKRLLKIHHPDRHGNHEGNMRKATEKTARVNAAYDRIEKWRQTGQSP
jgi:DnaJ-domain-containing protein 1